MGFNHSIKQTSAGKTEGTSHPYYIDYVMTAEPDDAEYAAHRTAPSPFQLIFFLGAPQEDTSWIKEEAEKASQHLLDQYAFSAARCVSRDNVRLELLSHLDPATSGVRLAFKTQEDRVAFTRFETLKHQKIDGVGAANQDRFHAPKVLNGNRISTLYTASVPEGSYPTPHRVFETLTVFQPYKHPHWWQTKAKNEGPVPRAKAPVMAQIIPSYK